MDYHGFSGLSWNGSAWRWISWGAIADNELEQEQAEQGGERQEGPQYLQAAEAGDEPNQGRQPCDPQTGRANLKADGVGRVAAPSRCGVAVISSGNMGDWANPISNSPATLMLCLSLTLNMSAPSNTANSSMRMLGTAAICRRPCRRRCDPGQSCPSRAPPRWRPANCLWSAFH